MTDTLPGLEGITVSRWLYQTLTADPTLQGLLGGAGGIGARVIEGDYTGTATEIITYTIHPPLDVKVVGMVQVMAQVRFQMKVVSQAAGYGKAIPIYQRAHDLVEGRAGVPITQGGRILTSQRVSGVQYPERANGIEYRHLGGTYETYTQ